MKPPTKSTSPVRFFMAEAKAEAHGCRRGLTPTSISRVRGDYKRRLVRAVRRQAAREIAAQSSIPTVQAIVQAIEDDCRQDRLNGETLEDDRNHDDWLAEQEARLDWDDDPACPRCAGYFCDGDCRADDYDPNDDSWYWNEGSRP